METKPEIPEHTLESWQKVVNLMAELTATPAGLIMRLEPNDLLGVLVASQSIGNVWKPGDSCAFESGVYCEEVVRSGDCLLVPDALIEPEWKNNPDMELGMSFYLGFPLLWPDGEPFGTICVLDSKSDNNAVPCKELIAQFGKVVENDLARLIEIQQKEHAQQSLIQIKTELENRVINRTRRLEEVNTALKVLLREHEETRSEIEASMLVNISELIIPNLHKARKCNDPQQRLHYLDLAEAELRNITSSFSSDLLQNFSDLTRTELQVADLIRQGKRTKEIADFLNTATSTIDYHRANIRKKMGLSKSSSSLNTFLTSRLN